MGQRARPGMGFGQGPMVRGGRREQVLGDRARETLTGAHGAFAAGRFSEAAPLFEKSARTCRDRGMARSAAWLGTLTSAAHAKAGDGRAALSALEIAIADARTDGDRQHSARVFGELLATLPGTPLESSAADLERAIREAVGVAPKAPGGAEVNRNTKRTLAHHCDACGAAVEPEKTRPTDDGADCGTCGSPL